MKGWSKAVLYIALLMLGAGAAVITLAWDGAASLDYTQGQVPYLISGGLGGLALVGVGLGLLIVHSVRSDLARLGVKLDNIAAGLHGVRSGPAAGPTAVPTHSDERVVAGRTTYHRPSCRVVEGRDDVQVMAPAAARDRGLTPCRICNPGARTA